MADGRRNNGVRPDSAWAWLVAIFNCLTIIVSYGAFRCLGVFYLPLMDEFGVEYGDVSLITGIGAAGAAFGALLPLMTRKYGTRATAMGSGLMLSLSALVSALSPSLAVILLFLGFCTGLMGGCLIYIAVLTCNQYFDKHRSKAVGIAILGIPLAGVILPPMLDVFITQYGWRGALILLSGIMLHSCVTAALYRPIDWSYHRSEMDTEKDENAEGNTMAAETNVDGGCDLKEPNEDTERKGNSMKRMLYSVHWKLFKNPSFIAMIISAMTYHPALIAFGIFLIPYGIERLQVTSLNASLLVSIVSVGDCIGKLAFGVIGDLKRTNKTLLMLTTTLLSAVFSVVMTIFDTYLPTAVFGFATACLFSAYLGLFSLVYRDIVGLKELPHALSFHGLLNATLMFPMLYVFGLSLEKSGDARVPFYICSGLWLLTAASILVAYILERRKERLS